MDGSTSASTRLPESTTRLKRLRAQPPLSDCALFQLCRKVFKASRLNLAERLSPPFFLCKRFFASYLWIGVHNCAKVANAKPHWGGDSCLGLPAERSPPAALRSGGIGRLARGLIVGKGEVFDEEVFNGSNKTRPRQRDLEQHRRLCLER